MDIRYRTEVGSKDRLTRAAWVDAAYAAFEAEGLRAVRVETLARQLETTKGSFYWHFASRGELVAEVMTRWEARNTDEVITISERAASAGDRLAALFATVAAQPWGGERTLYVEAATEGVTETVARVTGRRVAFVTGLLADLGVEPDEAHRRAVLALAIAVGLEQLGAGAGPQPLGNPELLIRSALAMLAAPAGSA